MSPHVISKYPQRVASVLVKSIKSIGSIGSLGSLGVVNRSAYEGILVMSYAVVLFSIGVQGLTMRPAEDAGAIVSSLSGGSTRRAHRPRGRAFYACLSHKQEWAVMPHPGPMCHEST